LILYLDTSALVKLYVQESSSERTRAATEIAEALATSVVAYAETRATFARLRHQGLTSGHRHAERIRQFNADWEHFLRVELTPTVVRNAGELAENYQLRGFDAIHLASALWLSAVSSISIHFAAFDQQLVRAAQ
jgi:uncharacterized protein